VVGGGGTGVGAGMAALSVVTAAMSGITAIPFKPSPAIASTPGIAGVEAFPGTAAASGVAATPLKSVPAAAATPTIAAPLPPWPSGSNDSPAAALRPVGATSLSGMATLGHAAVTLAVAAPPIGSSRVRSETSAGALELCWRRCRSVTRAPSQTTTTPPISPSDRAYFMPPRCDHKVASGPARCTDRLLLLCRRLPCPSSTEPP